jgi:photosystem II stability/assembly factor-like uncharacterized protein
MATTTACASDERATGDAGWERVYDRPADVASAIEMFDDQYGLAIVGHGLQRTLDGGRTWREVDGARDFGGYGTRIAIVNRDHAWIAANPGKILHTEDGGLTWETQTTGTTAPLNGISAVSADEAWATAYDAPVQGLPPHGDSALLHTVDGGERWSRVEVPGFGIFLGVWFNEEDGWVLATQCRPGDPTAPPEDWSTPTGEPPCIDRHTLLHTADNGRSWEVLWESPEGRRTVLPRIDRIDAQHAFALDLCDGLSDCLGYRLLATSDGGRTWENRRLSFEYQGILDLRFTTREDGWISFYVCGPPVSSCGFLPRLAHTGDGGATWEIVEVPEEIGHLLDVTTGAVITSSTGTGLSLYDVATKTWEASSTDARPEWSDLAFITRDTGYATTTSDEVWLTNDGGVTWSFGSDEFRWRLLPSDGLAAIDVARMIHLSKDGGRTSREITPPPEALSSSPYRVVAAFGDRVWLVLVDGLWRTDDAGATWKHVDTALQASYHFIDPQHVWTTSCRAVGCGETLRFSDDGGDTWVKRPAPPDAYSDFHFATPLDGWVGVHRREGDCQCQLVTHDGGRSWTTVSTAPWSLYAFQAVDSRRAWAVAIRSSSPTEAPVVVSTRDGGMTWLEELSLERWTSTRFVARDDRLWLYLDNRPVGVDGGTASPRRVVIYRLDIEPASARP